MTGPLDRPVFIGGTGSDGAASLAELLSNHSQLLATTPVRFGLISDAGGVIDAMLLAESMQKANKASWWERLVVAERQPAFRPDPMMGEERTPPEELVELLHRRFLPDPLLKPVGHRSPVLTAAAIERAAERYLATFWDNPRVASVTLIHDLLRPTHGAADDHSARRWIDASRLSAVRASDLLALFPEARFVHIVRDGREVALRFMEISTGSAFPGAPQSSVPIDRDKEWNQAAFERGLALWERRLISAASGLSRIAAERSITVRVRELQGPEGPEVVRSVLRRIDAPDDGEVVESLPRFLGRDTLQEGRVDVVAPPGQRAAIQSAYNATLARLDDLKVPLP